MVWNAFALILSPIVWLMEQLLSLFVTLTSSVGASILLLSFAMMILALPIRKRAQALETRINAKSKRVGDEVRALPKGLKGEKRFLATEKIYKEHAYHPIQAVGQGASFFMLLPILLSAIVLFSGSPLVENESFLFIRDLSKPDQLLFSLNLLPFLMTGITIADAHLRFAGDKGAQYKFYGIALVLLVLVYAMPSALVLYWTGSNLLTLATVWRMRPRAA
jgi:membrane protein insertase Oxa1/YidC/SpoIIIJ